MCLQQNVLTFGVCHLRFSVHESAEAMPVYVCVSKRKCWGKSNIRSHCACSRFMDCVEQFVRNYVNRQLKPGVRAVHSYSRISNAF